MAGLPVRTLLTLVVSATLFATACSSAVRYDTAWLDDIAATPAAAQSSEAAESTAPVVAAPQIVTEPVDEPTDDAPEQLAFVASDSTTDRPLPPPRPPAGTELPLYLQPYAEGPARVAEVGAANWSAFERSLHDNLAAGRDEPLTPFELASFEQASLAVCAGEVTPRSAAETFGLGVDAQRSLNVFVPAMCHLAPNDAGSMPGPTVGVLDWPMLIDTRWRNGAQWIDLDSFDEQARFACLGLDPTAAMSASSLAQIEALVMYGECALAWNA